MAGFVGRMIGAARLDAATYEEVESDPEATGQAALVVVLASAAGGIAALDESGMRGLVLGTLVNLVGWVAWAGITYLVGTKILPGPRTQSDVGQLLRTIGFSSAPGVLNVAGVIPGVGAFVAVVASLWMLTAMVVGVRQALDYDTTGRAVAVCLMGFLGYAAAVLIGSLLLFGALELVGEIKAR
jgi:hypothetical protein